MGFSLTGTHVIYFIASVIIASAVSGALIAVIQDVTSSFDEKGDDIQDKMDFDFKIINDPDNIPSDVSNYVFYMKNIGRKKISTSTTTFQVFVDGELLLTSNYSFTDESIQVGDVTTMNISKTDISAGSHELRVVGPQAIEDEFSFEI